MVTAGKLRTFTFQFDGSDLRIVVARACEIDVGDRS